MSYHPTGGTGTVSFTIPSGTPDRAAGVSVLGDVSIPTRDGISLGADVYLPGDLGPVPAIVIRQPYGRRTPEMGFEIVADFYARKGYACVVQDVRGKFSSGGTFDPGLNEIEDGYDTLDWVAAQPWCDGRVACWGESYYGFTSYAAAISRHPALRCIAPGDIGTDRRASWLRQGAFLLNTTGYWAMSMDTKEYGDVTSVDPYYLPLVEMPVSAGLEGAFFRSMVEHADDGEWWRERGLTHRIGEITVPVLCWGGWYDNYIGPMLGDYARLKQVHPSPEDVHLLVGPWDHDGSNGYTDRAVCHRLPATAQHRWDAYQAFFDRYLLGAEDVRHDEAGGSVDLFVLGANTWRHDSAWPPTAVVTTPVYLRAGGRLSFQVPEADEPADRFRYDPADPVPETIGRDCWALCTALEDRRRLDSRGDIVRYVGEPLADDLTIVGPITAYLHAASSAPDTDFTVTLCEVFADGTVNTIQDGIVRARYRRGLDDPSLIEPGEVYEYRLDLFATAYVARAGNRLRVDVSSSNFDRYDRNPNTGNPFGVSAELAVAEQTIHHCGRWPSRVELPVVATG